MKARCPMKTLNNKQPAKQATSFFGEMANRFGFLKEPAPVKKAILVETIKPVLSDASNEDIRVVGLDSYSVDEMSFEEFDGYQVQEKTQKDVNHASTSTNE